MVTITWAWQATTRLPTWGLKHVIDYHDKVVSKGLLAQLVLCPPAVCLQSWVRFLLPTDVCSRLFLRCLFFLA